jgi:opacity protein-like surface antigen
LAARPVFADATAFLGSDVTPTRRLVMGASAGIGLGLIGFEAEYAATSEDKKAGAPALKTGMANLLLQTPVPIAGFRPYVTAGGGFYRETLSTTSREHTSLGVNVGGGVKVTLIGPIRLRLDYRVFKLGSGALFSPAHRIYAGVNLGF